MGANSPFLKPVRFYGILDTGYVAESALKDKCEALVSAGCRIIQLRAKNESHSKRSEIADKLLPLFESEGSPFFIINDDADLAARVCKLIPNGGLHVGQDDLSPHEARKAIGNGILGLSTHSIEQAKAANSLNDTLDYFAVGPVYATATKPGRSAVGLQLVSEVAHMNPSLPWFAIGGVNMDTAASVRAAGAERIVAVSAVLAPDNTALAVRQLIKNFLG